ncbi:MAG: hypothetical protein AAGN66_25360 [Acidobacteriota bacterium]
MIHALDLDLPLGRITTVVGPGGSGKTTFLWAVAEDGPPESLWVEGDFGPPLAARLVVPQKAPRCSEPGYVLALLEDLPTHSIILLDEPFVQVPEEEHEALHRRLEELPPDRTVVCVTHNLRHSRRMSDHVVLLVEGELIESAPVDDFFERPQHPRTTDFLITGS